MLLARIRAQLRQHEQSEDAVFQLGPYSFRPAQKMLVDEADKKIRLTEKETNILKFLYRAPDGVVPRDLLLHEVWGYNAGVTTHTLETHIYRLRQKIEPELCEHPAAHEDESQDLHGEGRKVQHEAVIWQQADCAHDQVAVDGVVSLRASFGEEALILVGIEMEEGLDAEHDGDDDVEREAHEILPLPHVRRNLWEAQESSDLVLAQHLPHVAALRENELRHATAMGGNVVREGFDALRNIVAPA